MCFFFILSATKTHEMNRLLLICILSITTYAAHSQTSLLINSGKVINEAIALHDKGEYKKAIALYKTIPRSDTNYVRALYELSLSCLQDSSFVEGLAACEEGLKQGEMEHELDLMISKGSLLDELNGPEKAISFYDTALLKYPNAQSLLFNKAISLIRLKRSSEAERLLQTTVLQNPYFSSAHFRLASIAIQQGRIVPAMLSLATYLVINPSGRHYSNAITILNNISRGIEDTKEIVDNRKSEETTFQHAEQVLLSKIALDKNFKLQTGIDDPITRQLQALVEVIKYDASNKDFWMQFYVPLLKDLLQKKQFDPLMNQAFSALEIESIQKYIKKNSKEMKTAIGYVTTYLNSIRSTRELDYGKRTAMEALYHFNSDDVIAGSGKLDPKGEPVGKWTFFFSNGNRKSTGEFMAGGKKTGLWTFYFVDGKVSGTEEWKNGLQEGKDISYSQFGTVSVAANYINGKLQGEKKNYYGIGTLKSVANYKDDVQEGLYTEFYSSGRKRMEVEVKNDKLDGSYKTYHNNGEMAILAQYQDGNVHGPYKTFHDNGQVDFEGVYKNGKLEGPAKSFHPNGKIKEQKTFVNGEVEGKEETYNDQGVLISEINYEKGKAQGLASYYDDDSKRYSTFLFDKNILKEARYFDKEGKETHSYYRKNKTIDLTVISPDGYKSSTTVYNDAGQRIGKSIFYFPSGKTKETNDYQAGKLEGVTTGYFLNGKKSYELMFAGNEKNGKAEYYHFNGRIRLSGSHKEDNQDGTWTEYNERGHMISRYTYQNNDLHGYYEIFYANGKPNYEEKYHFGWLTEVNVYDTSGKLLSASKLKNVNVIYMGVHFNGKKKFEGKYVDGEYHGIFQSFFFDESIRVKKTYDKGLLDGEYTEYHYGGQPAISGKYHLGKRTGTWKYFDKKGKIWKEESYINNELNGVVKIFHDNGKVERELEYRNDELNGTFKRFAEDGQLIHVSYYKDDLLYGYAYLDKSNTLVKMLPLKAGSGKLISYYSNGNKSAEIEYADGKVNGRFELFHPNGNIMYRTHEVYNHTEGSLEEFYANGVQKSSYSYITNNMDGAYKEYYENKTLKEEGQYYNGLEHGVFKYYDASGKITAQHTFYYGTLINVSK
jgi:antitoxin component YwqK of YwqJK toxin-antitoxin module